MKTLLFPSLTIEGAASGCLNNERVITVSSRTQSINYLSAFHLNLFQFRPGRPRPTLWRSGGKTCLPDIMAMKNILRRTLYQICRVVHKFSSMRHLPLKTVMAYRFSQALWNVSTRGYKILRGWGPVFAKNLRRRKTHAEEPAANAAEPVA
jgi:hypothetical protein